MPIKIIPQVPNPESEFCPWNVYTPLLEILWITEKFFSSSSNFLIQTVYKEYSVDLRMLSSSGTQDSSKVTGSPHKALLHFLEYLWDNLYRLEYVIEI